MPAEYEWKSITIPETIEVEELVDLADIVGKIAGAIRAVAGVLSEVAEAYALLASGFDALLDALIQALQEVINGLLEMGLTYTSVIPTLGDLHSVETALEKLAVSVEDEYDLYRPNTNNGTSVELAMACFTARAPSLDLLLPILDSISKILSVSDFRNLVKTVEAEDEFYLANGGDLPDWSSAKITDAIPFVGDLLQSMSDLIAQLPAAKSFSSALVDMVHLIERKAALLEELANRIEAAFDIYISISGTPFEVLLVTGIMTNEELKTAIRSGAATIPNPYLNIGAVIAVSYVVPSGEGSVNLINKFLEMFGLDE